MLPIAWAVVEVENQFTWTWFLELVRNDLELGQGHELTLITDMPKGLEIVVQELLPLVEHKKCARHVLANWCKNWKEVERRRVFWKIAKSTFEAELKDNIQEIKKLGRGCLDDLLWYNLNIWCKVYFQEYSKCDVVDNNMAESFNAWILPARYITIITMLEEIRVKMMKRIGDLRQFSNTWISDISPMSLKILQENIDKSMQCNLSWNGERGFEIKHNSFTHTVDIVSMSCTCRSWQLRGIPYPHGVFALHYKELEPISYVSSYYNKETYLITYAYFIQPMNNMKMCPTSNNSTVKPPKVKKLPERPSKVRRKEANESRKIGELSKCGAVMTCSKCGTQGHNKRGCPTRDQADPTQSAETSTHAQATGRAKGRGKGTGRGSVANVSARSSSQATGRARARGRGSVASASVEASSQATSRGRGSVASASAEASSHATSNNKSGTSQGRERSSVASVPTQLDGTTTYKQTQQRNVNEGIDRGGMSQQIQTTSEATDNGRGLVRGKRPVEYDDSSGVQIRPFKRPRMVGVGIYQVEDGFTTLNIGLPSRRVINTGTRLTKRADVVTGDIGYTPKHGFKWKGEDNYYQ